MVPEENKHPTEFDGVNLVFNLNRRCSPKKRYMYWINPLIVVDMLINILVADGSPQYSL